jgi:hypothetical protein
MNVNTEKPVTFKTAFDQQPEWLQRYMKAKIRYRCGWGNTTFYNKMNGVTPMRPPEKAVVALLFAKHGVDAWSGEEIEFR